MKYSARNVKYKTYENGNVAVITRGLAGIRYEVLNSRREILWQKFVPFPNTSTLSYAKGPAFDSAKQFQDLFARKASNGKTTQV